MQVASCSSGRLCRWAPYWQRPSRPPAAPSWCRRRRVRRTGRPCQAGRKKTERSTSEACPPSRERRWPCDWRHSSCGGPIVTDISILNNGTKWYSKMYPNFCPKFAQKVAALVFIYESIFQNSPKIIKNFKEKWWTNFFIYFQKLPNQATLFFKGYQAAVIKYDSTTFSSPSHHKIGIFGYLGVSQNVIDLLGTFLFLI